MSEEISVPIEWFESLLQISKLVQKDQDEWYQSEKPLMPTSISRLIGFSASAESIIQNNTRYHCSCGMNGVSAWKNYGQKNKYWDYFAEQIREEAVKELVALLTSNNKGAWLRILNQFK